MARRIIGVFGAGHLEEKGPEWRLAEEVGRRIGLAGHVLLTGGLGGVMAAASKGARESGGLTIGLLPGDRRTGPGPNPFVDLAIYTGMGEARNVINVKSCHAAIAIGGEYGTLSEIALALKAGCPLVLLRSWTFAPYTGSGPEHFLRAGDAAEAVEKAVAAIPG